MNWRLEHSDAVEFLRTLDAGSVHVVCTSPPYYHLRDYKCDGQIGLEQSVDAYLDRLLGVFDEVRRVLHETGTVFVNIGDSYAQAGDLMGVPERFALAMQSRGWLWRDRIALLKPSAMPESVSGWSWRQHRLKVSSRDVSGIDDFATNSLPAATWKDCPGCPKCDKNDGLVLRRGSWRTTRAWEFLFMFAKSQRYYADGEAVRTTPAEATIERDQYSRILDDPDEAFAVRHDHETVCGGANLRSWWRWVPSPLKEKHYAAFSPFLPERCILAGTSDKGYCVECGEPWVRVISKPTVGTWHDHSENLTQGGRQNGCGPAAVFETAKTTGWRPSCRCGAASVPGIVCDPFAGSGTTLMVALRLGRHAVGCDISDKYVEMARRRIQLDSPLYNTMAGQCKEREPC